MNRDMGSINKLKDASVEQLEGHYDDWAIRYDEDLLSMGYRAHEFAADDMATLIGDRHAPVLDAGCGTGLTGRSLYERGFDSLVGIDLSAESLALAETKKCYDKLAKQDLDQPLTFGDDTFAHAQCIGTLTYVKDVEAFFREICRVVRTGGIFLYSQRTDLHDEAFEAVTEKLSHERLWSFVSRSEPRPYIPGDPDYGDRIEIIFDAFRVR